MVVFFLFWGHARVSGGCKSVRIRHASAGIAHCSTKSWNHPDSGTIAAPPYWRQSSWRLSRFFDSIFELSEKPEHVIAQAANLESETNQKLNSIRWQDSDTVRSLGDVCIICLIVCIMFVGHVLRVILTLFTTIPYPVNGLSIWSGRNQHFVTQRF